MGFPTAKRGRCQKREETKGRSHQGSVPWVSSVDHLQEITGLPAPHSTGGVGPVCANQMLKVFVGDASQSKAGNTGEHVATLAHQLMWQNTSQGSGSWCSATLFAL